MRLPRHEWLAQRDRAGWTGHDIERAKPVCEHGTKLRPRFPANEWFAGGCAHGCTWDPRKEGRAKADALNADALAEKKARAAQQRAAFKPGPTRSTDPQPASTDLKGILAAALGHVG